MIRVIILGYGNLGRHLSKSLHAASDLELVQVYNRSSKKVDLPEIEFTNDLTELKQADVYVLAVSDDVISDLSDRLPFENRLVVHTSGVVPMSALNSKNRKGVFYPLQSFSNGRTIDFSEIPICLEAEKEKDLEVLRQIATNLSDNVQEINSEKRKQLHVAAVFVNNFVNHLYLTASELLAEHELDFDLLRPLIKETAAKLDQLSVYEAQTGPAKRNDLETIKKHLHLLDNKRQKKLYKMLTKAIRKSHGKKL